MLITPIEELTYQNQWLSFKFLCFKNIIFDPHQVQSRLKIWVPSCNRCIREEIKFNFSKLVSQRQSNEIIAVYKILNAKSSLITSEYERKIFRTNMDGRQSFANVDEKKYYTSLVPKVFFTTPHLTGFFFTAIFKTIPETFS